MKQIFKNAVFFIIGIISLMLFAYIKITYNIKLAIIVMLMNLPSLSILLYELLRQKQYSFIKRVASEIPFVFTFGIALEFWYGNVSPIINILYGVLMAEAYFMLRLILQIKKIRKL